MHQYLNWILVKHPKNLCIVSFEWLRNVTVFPAFEDSWLNTGVPWQPVLSFGQHNDLCIVSWKHREYTHDLAIRKHGAVAKYWSNKSRYVQMGNKLQSLSLRCDFTCSSRIMVELYWTNIIHLRGWLRRLDRLVSRSSPHRVSSWTWTGRLWEICKGGFLTVQ